MDLVILIMRRSITNITALIGFRENLKVPPCMSVLLQPRSLLVFTESAYTSYFHGIEEVDYDVC